MNVDYAKAKMSHACDSVGVKNVELDLQFDGCVRVYNRLEPQ